MRIVALGAAFGAALLLAAPLAAGPAQARDNCPRLESSSLVILIPEGGCDADASAMLSAAKEVTVIRGAGYSRVSRAAPVRIAQEATPPASVVNVRRIVNVSVIVIRQNRVIPH